MILPLESVAPVLRDFTYFNPFVLAEKLVREVFIFQAPLNLLWSDISLLIGYAFTLFILILIIESLSHQHLIQHYLQHYRQNHRHKDHPIKDARK